MLLAEMESVLPTWFLIVLVGFCGLAFGSFVTLVSWRLPREEPIVKGRSQCPSCKKKLGVRTLIPFFSWVMQGGECHYCKKKINFRYPAIELAQGMVFLLIYFQMGLNVPSLILMLASVAIMVLIVVDLEWYIIPDEIQVTLLVLALPYLWTSHADWSAAFASGALGLGVGLALRFGYSFLRKREGLGWGDVKFLPIAGLWLGQIADWPPFLFYAGALGILTALFWKMMGQGARFPFGPALAVAMLIDVLYDGGQLFYWTLHSISA